MTRAVLVRLLVGIAVLGFVAWIVHNSTLEETLVDLPLTGGAADNPHYALEHLLKPLGVRLQTVPTFEVPATHDVLLARGFGQDSRGRDVDDLQRWVRAGGHLVIDGSRAWRRSFQDWSGIKGVVTAPAVPEPDTMKDKPPTGPAKKRVSVYDPDRCETVQEQRGADSQARTLCGVDGFSLKSKQPASWSVSSDAGVIALSARVGSGTVTVLPSTHLYENRELLKGDNARVALAALDLRHGSVLYVFENAKDENLFHLLWRLAAPGLLLLGLAILLLIVRQLPRFGTAIPAPAALRRSLAEQIRATAGFAWRTRRLQALRRAVTRALDESASQQIAAYRRLDSRRRAEMLAQGSGLEAATLRSALNEAATADADVQRQAIATLLTARRRFMQRYSKRGPP